MFAQKKRIFTSHDYFDGQTGAASNSLSPLTPKSKSAVAKAKVGMAFYRILDWKSLYKSVKVTGRSKAGAEPCYVIELTSPAGSAVQLYLSAQTYLPVKQLTSMEIPGVGSLPVSEAFSDYRAVDGIKIPFVRAATNPITGETIETVTRVRFNVPLADTAFRPPAAPSP